MGVCKIGSMKEGSNREKRGLLFLQKIWEAYGRIETVQKVTRVIKRKSKAFHSADEHETKGKRRYFNEDEKNDNVAVNNWLGCFLHAQHRTDGERGGRNSNAYSGYRTEC